MPGFQHKRSDKVGQLIQQELASMLVEKIKDPRVGFVTVTEVRVTDDLRQAKAFVSVYGSQAERKKSLEGLTAASSFLRREICARLQLRHAPDLIFALDETLDEAAKLETLFHAIADGQDEAPTSQLPDVVPVATSRSEFADNARAFHTPKRK